MKQMLCKFIVLCAATVVLSSCSWLSLNGDASPRSKNVISVSVPADPIPATVKPLPTSLPVQDPPKQSPRKLPRRVEQKLLPRQSSSSEESLREIPLEPARQAGNHAFAELPDNGQPSLSVNASAVYDKALLSEDVTWRGTVLVKGYVVVAPQATLRMEPGTVVRFAGSGDGSGESARLVVQGRIQAVGSAELPIILTSDRPKPTRGDWGGISFVSSEKRNVLEQCRIEYASAGIQAIFSTVSLKAVSITGTQTGLLIRDSVVQMTGGTVTESEAGIEAHDSELELRDASIAGCKSGMIINRSAVGFSAVKVRDNQLIGISSEDCRIKITAGEVSGNGFGVRLKGGEGQILATRFSGNLATALQLSGSRIKVQRCGFVDNGQDAVRLEDGRALITGNYFSGNKGFNIYNAGPDKVVALQNWWGSGERAVILQKIHDAVRDLRSGPVQLFPWLTEKPQQLP